MIDVDSVNDDISDDKNTENKSNPWGDMNVDDIPLDIIHDSPSKSYSLSHAKVKCIKSLLLSHSANVDEKNVECDADSKSEDTSDDSTIGTEPNTSLCNKLDSCPIVIHVQHASNIVFNPFSDTE